MDRKETLKVLGTIKVAYPNSFSRMADMDFETLINLWQMQFKDYDYKLVMSSIDVIIANDLNNFMPTIARVKEVCRNLSGGNQMSELEAWQYIKKALSNSIYHAKEEFDELPSICQKLVGTPSQLREWAILDTTQVDTIVHSNFLKLFRSYNENKRQQEMIPSCAKERLMIGEKYEG